MTTHTTRRRGAAGALAILSLLLAWLVVGANPAHADSASLTLSKGTGLNPDGEPVTVTGKSFLPGINVFVVVCDPAQPAGKACDMANFKMATVDAGGNFVADIKAAAKFGTTDCLVTPCAVQTSRVGQGKDRTQEALAAIGFTGGVAPSLPARPQENSGGPGASAPAPDASAGASAGAPSAQVPAGQSAAAPGSGTSPATDSAGADKDDDSDTGLIIGVVAAVVVVGGAAAFFVVRRRSAG